MDMKRRWPALVLIAAVAACQASSSSPAGGTGAAPTATPSSTPATSSREQTAPPSFGPLATGPALSLAVVGDEPVLVRGAGPPDHDAVLPGAAAVDRDGTIVAFLTWFADAPGDQVVTVGRSVDGITWMLDPDPIYTDLGLGLAPPGPIPAAAFQGPDGSWTLFGWGADPIRRTSFFSWRATAPAPEGPWAIGPGEDRVLPPGPAAAWDDETAAVASVLPDGDGFAMWYEGQRPGRAIRGGIGYAASPEGIAWTRDPEPIIAPGQCGPGTAQAVLEPQVWQRSDGYLMLFSGYAEAATRPSIFAASSLDGRTWSCTGQALLDSTDIPGSEGIHTIQGVTVAGEPALLVESLHDRGSELWLVSVDIAS